MIIAAKKADPDAEIDTTYSIPGLIVWAPMDVIP
jgi:hypothetical protein